VLAPGAFGGLERVVTQLACGLAGRDVPVAVAAILDAGADEPDCLGAMRQGGVEVFPLVMPPRAYGQARGRVGGIIASWNPQVVHTHGYLADVLMRGVIQRSGRPAVATAHGFTGGGPKNRLFEWLDRRALRRFDAAIAVSRALADRLTAAGVPPERLHLIPNAWAEGGPLASRQEARVALGLGADGVVIGWVGRLGREKGPDVAVRALAQPDLESAQLVVAGAGRELVRLQELARQLGVAARVHWQGPVPSVARWFRAFDAFCLSSRTEGTPMVLFEAMAAGVPVVATRVGGVPDVVSEEEAILVPSEDPAALAQGIRSVLHDPDAAAARSARALDRLHRKFSLVPWLKRHETLYHSLVTRT